MAEAEDPNDAMLVASGLRVVGPLRRMTADNLDFLAAGEVHGVTVETIWPLGHRDTESARD